MKKFSLLVMMVCFAVVLAACGTNPAKETNSSNKETVKEEPKELTMKHQLGETTVKVNPKKVVVFDFGILDSLDKLNIEVTGVPQANIPPYLSKFEDDKYVNVGSLKEPDFEKINEIGPDLIIISARQQEAYKELSEIAPTIYLGVDPSKYMESFTDNMETIGKLFEKEKEIAKELESIDQSIKQLKEKATADEKNSLVVLANDGNISAFGPGSRFGLIHDVFGFKAVDENIEISRHGQSVSFEYVIEKDPEYLFVIDRGAVVGGQSSAKQIIENSLIKNTTAYKNNHIIYLDPNYWYLSGGGLVSVPEMIKEIEKGIE
ncbi:siderophore ABC transporter substrate-binding protein [Bacillus aquiflavi]|uniref:Siderophore ABC transporter substrate-binding protein n=1 Tax=Bacillus aquiflavi TaxID=2672567 RepID=A0A6B3W2E8_9BACI|nr:siderophore ABC transporter substrate-binding protein [Bacillus aquiflavi]MBA4537810.1 siderophore ABC transporter substrate-binding protein [Bacillus aquiflavi]NEY82066.1 siderophore ABC transporter substrate-binding protein [Bacillus aquiflavi]